MNEEQWISRLESLDPGQEGAVQALAADVASAALGQPREAAGIWRTSDSAMSGKARALLGRLEELRPALLLEEAGPLKVEQEVWLLRTVVLAQISLRQQFIGRLRSMLDDRQVVSVSMPGSPPERFARPRRTCDQVFLWAGRLADPEESDEAFRERAARFYALPEAERDREILRSKRSPVWNRLLEELE